MAIEYTSWTTPASVRQINALENGGVSVNSPAWSNLSSMLTSDGNFATVDWTNGEPSFVVLGYNFGFAVPENSVIKGFQCRIQRKGSNYVWPSRGVATFRLWVTDQVTEVANVVTDNNRLQYANPAPADSTDILWTTNSKLVQELTSSTNLHNQFYGSGALPISWTPNKVNSSQFGYGFSPIPLNDSSPPITGSVDYFQVRIAYEEAAPVANTGGILLAF